VCNYPLQRQNLSALSIDNSFVVLSRGGCELVAKSCLSGVAGLNGLLCYSGCRFLKVCFVSEERGVRDRQRHVQMGRKSHQDPFV